MIDPLSLVLGASFAWFLRRLFSRKHLPPKRCGSTRKEHGWWGTIETIQCPGDADPRCLGGNCTAHCQKFCGGRCMEDFT